mmetsp:Transcript_41837/g.126871  ORF Transcript_41837/g.126871 Transcript_41837/m.126871 type:complete len:267 (-) Transcript_41837:28-828(-)
MMSRRFLAGLAVLLLFDLIRAQSSGCETCAATGRCDHAYHNKNGQYCGAFRDPFSNRNHPCCCPIATICKMSTDACRCHVPSHPQPSHESGPGSGGGKYPSSQPVDWGDWNDDPYWFVRLTFVILMLVICCCCCVPSCFNRESADMMSESIPVAVPYISSGNPPPTAPTWTQEAEYVDTGRSRGGGAMGGIAPALGGLAVGTVIGNIMGRHNRREGFSGPGNTDYGAVGSSGTYDIQGDTGGYDIAGDSGGDFGGDDGGYDITGDS